MKTRHLISAAALALCSCAASAFTPTDAAGWELIWADDFDKDGAPDSTYWNFENGFVRNNELQWYQPQNAVCRDGVLVIEARQEKAPNPLYSETARRNDWRRSRPEIECTSASINTRGKFDFLYGRMEVSAKIPTPSGSWPAIWLLGNEHPWPSNGEIDIMEYYRIGNVPHILANAAWGGDRPYNAVWDSAKIPFSHFTEKDPAWADKFHLWTMDWTPESINIYLDGELLNNIDLTKTVNGPAAAEGFNPFRQSQYILLNLAISGDNGGDPDWSQFPLRYEVDYVKVYKPKK